MKNAFLFFLVASIMLYGCALSSPELTARERQRQFDDFSMARAQSLNAWWGK